jgi:uncharacterized protein YbaR (Trm112 family)
MISPELMEILRCPNDPSNTRLTEEEGGLVCQRCRIKFPIKEGIPCLIVEEAELPPGVASLDELPCRAPRPNPEPEAGS